MEQKEMVSRGHNVPKMFPKQKNKDTNKIKLSIKSLQ